MTFSFDLMMVAAVITILLFTLFVGIWGGIVLIIKVIDKIVPPSI